MTYEEWLDAIEAFSRAWNDFCSSMTDAVSEIQKLWGDIREMAYTKPSIPPKKYGTRKKKDYLFRNQTLKSCQTYRKIRKHQPYYRRIF